MDVCNYASYNYWLTHKHKYKIMKSQLYANSVTFWGICDRVCLPGFFCNRGSKTDRNIMACFLNEKNLLVMREVT